MANKIYVNGEYDWKLRLKLGLKRFMKGLGASLLITAIQYATEFIQSNPDVFPQQYTIYLGLTVSALLGLEKSLQKKKK